MPDLVFKILHFFSIFIVLHPIDTQRREYVELYVLTLYLTTRQQIMCTFWKNKRNVIHSMNTGLIHYIRQIYVRFDKDNDLFTTRSKILWFIQIIVHSMFKFSFFDVKSCIWVQMSTFSSNTVLLNILHRLNITRLEFLDNLENGMKLPHKRLISLQIQRKPQKLRC